MKHKPLVRVILQIIGLQLLLQNAIQLLSYGAYLAVAYFNPSTFGGTPGIVASGLAVLFLKLGLGAYLLMGGELVLNRLCERAKPMS